MCFTNLVVFPVKPAATILCWDTLSSTEFEARVTLTSFLTASTGPRYIQMRANIRTAMSARVVVAVITTLKGWWGKKDDLSISI